MEYKFVETNKLTGKQRICFLRRDDIVSIDTDVVNYMGQGNMVEVIIIYTRSSPPLTLPFFSTDEQEQFIREFTEDFHPREFEITWRRERM